MTRFSSIQRDSAIDNLKQWLAHIVLSNPGSASFDVKDRHDFFEITSWLANLFFLFIFLFICLFFIFESVVQGAEDIFSHPNKDTVFPATKLSRIIIRTQRRVAQRIRHVQKRMLRIHGTGGLLAIRRRALYCASHEKKRLIMGAIIAASQRWFLRYLWKYRASPHRGSTVE